MPCFCVKCFQKNCTFTHLNHKEKGGDHEEVADHAEHRDRPQRSDVVDHYHRDRNEEHPRHVRIAVVGREILDHLQRRKTFDFAFRYVSEEKLFYSESTSFRNFV